MAPSSIRMTSTMKVNGTQTNEVDGDGCISRTARSTRESGLMTSVAARECSGWVGTLIIIIVVTDL